MPSSARGRSGPGAAGVGPARSRAAPALDALRLRWLGRAQAGRTAAPARARSGRAGGSHRSGPCGSPGRLALVVGLAPARLGRRDQDLDQSSLSSLISTGTVSSPSCGDDFLVLERGCVDAETDVDEVAAEVGLDLAVEESLEPVGPELALLGRVGALGQFAVEVLPEDLAPCRSGDQLVVALLGEDRRRAGAG